MDFRALVLLAALLASCSAPRASAGDEPDLARSTPELFGNLGSWRRNVTTQSHAAQRWFDQAFALTFAFNHDEAIRSYEEASRLDPSCAMAWWGVAYCHGPHINNATMDEARSRAAWDAVQKAVALAPESSEVEQALIAAVATRYSADPAADRAPLDRAYAEAMREAWKAHPKDPDVGTLFAESLMDLHPWDLWTHDGQAKEDTPEIVETLERVLAVAPNHPGANHFYIHTVEASPHPERAVASADRLRTLVPGAGHLVHMPAHIYARVGRWADAGASNERAIEVDTAYQRRSPEQGFYRIYMSHNRHFLSWGSMMEGRSEVALRVAREMVARIPPESLKEMAVFVDGLAAMPLAALMRFGRWEEILAEPEPPAFLPSTRALRHFARGAALAATGRLDEAEKEKEALDSILAATKADAVVGNSQARDVLGVASNALAGEIAAQRGDSDEAVAKLLEAARIEDGLKYNEPPDWLQPVRHTLGAVLLRAGRAAEAEAVYREDLARWPENGWALWGLSRALERQGRTEDARAAEARFRKAWERADVKIDTTCFCLPGI